jgi:hypothetical protein
MTDPVPLPATSPALGGPTSTDDSHGPGHPFNFSTLREGDRDPTLKKIVTVEGVSAVPVHGILKNGKGVVESLQKHCDEIARASPDNVHRIASLMQKMIIEYYQDVRRQALLAFFAALGLEVVAVVFFFVAALAAVGGGVSGTTTLSAISGFLIQVMTAIVFYLYSQSARQFAGFHICLERTNRFLLANSMVEHLPEPDRNAKRAEVITTVLNAPMLTLAMMEKAS